MTPEQLKASILQYAIQGKLTPQIESDGTAKSLLESCSTGAEIDGRRVKQKIIAEIADDEKTFDIPESWEWVKLGNVCTIARGGSPRPIKEYITTADDGINWIKIGDTEKDGKYICSTAEKIKPSGASKSRMVHAGDFLLTNSMSFGRPYILKVDGCIHDGWLVISQTKEVFYQDYLYWMLSSRYAYFQFCDKVSGAVVKNLNSDKVANSVFPLPPLSEQKRIVAKIEELLPYVDRYAAAYEKLEQFNAKFPEDMKKSVLQYAIQGKLVEQRPEEGTGEELLKLLYAKKEKIIKSGVLKGRKTKPLQSVSPDDAPFEIPDTWCWVRLGTVAEIFGRIGFRGYTKNDIVSAGEGAITISPSNIRPNGKTDFSDCTYLSWEKYEESPEIKVFNGDILLVKTGSSYGKCGIVCDLPEKATINPQLAILKYITCEVKYLDYVLKSPMARNQFESFVIGTSIPTFSQEKLANLLLPLPPLAEQKRIVAKLEEILPLCEQLK